MTLECRGSWFGVHKFTPRYDYGAAQGLERIRVEGLQAIKDIIEAMRPRTYVRDVCERCGETVERDNG